MEAADELKKDGISAEVIAIHTIKPLDEQLLAASARKTGAVLTAEEHSVLGGLGGAVSEALSGTVVVPVVRAGVQDRYCETGPYDCLLDNYGMSVEDIVAGAKRAIALKA